MRLVDVHRDRSPGLRLALAVQSRQEVRSTSRANTCWAMRFAFGCVLGPDNFDRPSNLGSANKLAFCKFLVYKPIVQTEKAAASADFWVQ